MVAYLFHTVKPALRMVDPLSFVVVEWPPGHPSLPGTEYPSVKGPSLILLAFLLPFSIYLFILGYLNRRRHAVMVSGVTDFIGVLFAASGFLLFGGPGILSSLNDRWRLFWLLGQRPGNAVEGLWQFWIFLSVLYFLVIVVGALFILRGQRHLTAVYNADLGLIQRCLVQVCEQLGLDPARSGNLFVFGVEPAGQAAPALLADGPANILVQQTAVLEVEPFARLRHVTLRWDPADSALRRQVERELAKVLMETPAEPSDLGLWLAMIGVTLFGLTVIAAATLVAVRTLI